MNKFGIFQRKVFLFFLTNLLLCACMVEKSGHETTLTPTAHPTEALPTETVEPSVRHGLTPLKPPTPKPPTPDPYQSASYLSTLQCFSDPSNCTQTGFAEPDMYYNALSLLMENEFTMGEIAEALKIMPAFYGYAAPLDLNNDTIQEFAIAGVIMLEYDPSIWLHHIVTFYRVDEQHDFTIHFEGTFNGSPDLFELVDLDSDGYQELVVFYNYGGTWCSEFIFAIHYSDIVPIDYFEEVDSLDFYDCPAQTNMVDLNGDGVVEFVQCHRNSACLNTTPPGSYIYWLEEGHYSLEVSE